MNINAMVNLTYSERNIIVYLRLDFGQHTGFGTYHINAKALINAHVNVPSGTRGLNVILRPHLHQFCVYKASSEGSGEAASLCAASTEPSLLESAISSTVFCAGSTLFYFD